MCHKSLKKSMNQWIISRPCPDQSWAPAPPEVDTSPPCPGPATTGSSNPQALWRILRNSLPRLNCLRRFFQNPPELLTFKTFEGYLTNSAGSLNSSLLKTKTLRSVEKNLGRLGSKGHASPFGCDTVRQSLYGYLGYKVPKFCWKVGSLIGVN